MERALREQAGDPAFLEFAQTQELRRVSLAIFDRSFAVTYALEAIAVAIGLAGVTSSFAALAWSRRREFGALRFLGLTRHDVLKLLAMEGAAAGAVGAAIGLACGAAVSFVLVKVVNRQSFHWGMALSIPWLTLVVAAILVLALGIWPGTSLDIASAAALPGGP